MLCYKDMTFCEQKTCLKFAECHRALTEKVKLDADEWWGRPGAPLSIFVGKPGCYKER